MASDSIAESIGWSAGDIDSTSGGTGSTFASIGLIVAVIGLIFAEFDSIVEHIGWIVGGTDSTFEDIDSTFAGIGSIVAGFDLIVGDIDLIFAAFEHDFHCIAGYNFGLGDNFAQMKLLEQSQPIPVLRILHTHIRRYCRSSRSHSSFDLARKTLLDGMI